MGLLDADRIKLLLDLGRAAEAETAARKLIGEDPESFAGYYYLAHALKALDRYTEALDVSDTALAKNPALSTAHIQRTSLLLILDRVAEAVDCARAAIRLDPDDPDAYSHLAAALVAAERWEEARAVVTDARSRFPDHTDILFPAAVLALTEERLEELAALARFGQSRNAADPRFHLLAGIAASRQAKQLSEGPDRQQCYQEAERLLAEAVRMWPTEALYRRLRKENASDSRDDAMTDLMAKWLLMTLAMSFLLRYLLVRSSVPWWAWLSANAVLWLVSVLFSVFSPEFNLVAPLWRKDIVTIPLMPEERRKGRVLWAVVVALTAAVLFLPRLLFGG